MNWFNNQNWWHRKLHCIISTQNKALDMANSYKIQVPLALKQTHLHLYTQIAWIMSHSWVSRGLRETTHRKRASRMTCGSPSSPRNLGGSRFFVNLSHLSEILTFHTHIHACSHSYLAISPSHDSICRSGKCFVLVWWQQHIAFVEFHYTTIDGGLELPHSQFHNKRLIKSFGLAQESHDWLNQRSFYLHDPLPTDVGSFRLISPRYLIADGIVTIFIVNGIMNHGLKNDIN